MNLEQIEKLNELKEKGMITEAEYQRAKEKILASEPVGKPGEPIPVAVKTDKYDYAMMMHMAQFAYLFVPLLGLIIPFVMWQLRQNDDDYINQQGKVVMNWALSFLIYAVICWVLMLILIGFVLMAVLYLIAIVFIIMGSINASKGVVKNYPLSIRFFMVAETTQV
jgi:uncharacterized protein